MMEIQACDEERLTKETLCIGLDIHMTEILKTQRCSAIQWH